MRVPIQMQSSADNCFILVQPRRRSIILRIPTSQNRLFLSTLLRGRRDYAVARFRKKMNYLFVRPPPKRREREGESVCLVRVFVGRACPPPSRNLSPFPLAAPARAARRSRPAPGPLISPDCRLQGGRGEERGGLKQSFFFRPPSTFITSAGRAVGEKFT